jgi:hypothetical protein
MSCCLSFHFGEPACLNLEVEQGGSWDYSATLYTDALEQTPFDLTGYTGTMKFVNSQNTATVVMTATVTIPTPTNGEILCHLPATTTAAISPSTVMFYDLLLSIADPDPTFYVIRGSAVMKEGYSG